MELTIAVVWPGADVSIEGRRFRIKAERTPAVWLTSPRGIELRATVGANRSLGGVTLPDPGRFERSRTRRAQPYSIGGLDVWGYSFSAPDNGPFYLAVWFARRDSDSRTMPQTHAVAEVSAVLDAGGGHDAAAFQAAMRYSVNVRWDLKPFPPFQEYVVGSGWRQLQGYYGYQTELARVRPPHPPT